MKMLGLILVIVLAFSGCASFRHTESIDTDQLGGYASGQFRHEGTGPVGSFSLAGGGGGWGSGGGGLGLGAISVTSGPVKSNAYNFAKAIATINYSKKLKSIKYDEFGGIIEYEFEQTPVSMKSSPKVSRSNLPSSFGHQPSE